MREFFDSSVFFAAFSAGHPGHEESLTMVSKASPRFSACAAHTLAEVYATMTSLPGRNRVSPVQALLFTEEIRGRCQLISLDSDEYLAAVTQASSLSLVSGQIYDWLVMRCAEKVGAKTIYTWNVRHFEQFYGRRIRTP